MRFVRGPRGEAVERARRGRCIRQLRDGARIGRVRHEPSRGRGSCRGGRVRRLPRRLGRARGRRRIRPRRSVAVSSSRRPCLSPSSCSRCSSSSSSTTGSGSRCCWRRRSCSGAHGRSTSRAWQNLKHRAATMDTLISVGTLAAWGWSVVALFFLGAGEPGMRMGFELVFDRDEAAAQIYFEVAAVVTTFILAGRYFEARAKRRAGAALAALLELGAKDVSVLDATGGAARARRGLLRSATASSSGRARRSRPTASSRRALRGRQVDADRRERPGRGRARRRGRRRRRSTSAAASSCARRASAPTRHSPRSRGSSTRRSRARRRCSGWPTAISAVFVPIVIVIARRDTRVLARAPAPARRSPSPPRSRC